MTLGHAMLQRPDHLLLAALLGTGLTLKLLWLGNNALAHDEPFTVYWALQPWHAFRAMLQTENNPPLYFMLMRIWAPLVPLDPAWLRLPSALFSVFTVWPLYLLGKRLSGTTAALAASLIFTLSGFHYGFAHEVRAYSLFTLLTVLSLWQLVRLADAQQRAWGWLLIVNILLVYTHFFGWLVVGLQALFLLLIKEFKPAGKNWTWMAGPLVLSYTPYAYIFFSRAGQSITQGTWLDTPHPEEVYNMLWRWSNAPVIAVLLLLLIVHTAIRHKCRGTALSLGLIWTFVPLLGLFLVSYLVPVYLDRYLVFAAPGWALLAGTSLAMLPSHLPRTGVACLALGLLASFEPWTRSAHNPENVVQQVREWRRLAPCAQVFVVPAWYRLTYRFAENPERFATEAPELMFSHELEPGDPTCAMAILVDADAPDAASKELVQRLRSTHQATDSVQASHNVRVQRFLRRP